MLSNLLKDKFFNFMNSLFKDNNSNDSIIEPLSCLIRIAILEFKPLGTKISINNNRIQYNDPNVFQGALRWSNGDNREDIHNIFNPIMKACEWFDTEDEIIKNIFLFSIKGLDKLKKSYNINSTISHSITYYKNYINDKISTNKKENKKEENTIFIKLRALWNDREISIINNILLELNECNQETSLDKNITLKKISLIKALESILERKEKSVTDILIETTTSLK